MTISNTEQGNCSVSNIYCIKIGYMYSKYILTESEKNDKSDISYIVVTACSNKI